MESVSVSVKHVKIKSIPHMSNEKTNSICIELSTKVPVVYFDHILT